MRILMLTPYLPYPLFSGGQIRSYNLLKNLSRKHEITLFSFIRQDEEKQCRNNLLKFCREVQLFKRRRAWSLTNILFAAFTPYPFLVSLYYSLAFKNSIIKELSNTHYDLIHSETFYVMPNIPKTNVSLLLVEQTIEFLVYQHYVDVASFYPIKPVLSFDVAKIRFWEKYFWKKAKKVVAMSQADLKVMKNIDKTLDVTIVPNGIDVDFFSLKRKKIKRDYNRILFVGNFKWLQNREAVAILVKNLWPDIKRKIPKAKLWIVGKHSTKEIKNLAQKDIIVDENVSDIRYAYQNADVLLAPIEGAGGTRYKILEAMASGLPVVTTPTGIEGIGAVDCKHALIKAKAAQLVAAVIEVLENKKLAKSLSINGKKFVTQNFNWEKISYKLDQIYEEVAKDG